MDLNFAKEKGGDGVSNAREVRAQRTIRNSARQCDKQGADAHENPGTSLSLATGVFLPPRNAFGSSAEGRQPVAYCSANADVWKVLLLVNTSHYMLKLGSNLRKKDLR